MADFTLIHGSDSMKVLGMNHQVATYEPKELKLPVPILAIHGMWGTDRRWRNFGHFFSELGFRFYAPSLRHHFAGNEKVRELGMVSVMDYVSDIVFLIKSLGLQSPIIMGHSMGGLIAQKLASLGLASKLVLINSAPPAGVKLHADWRYQLAMLHYLPKMLLSRPFKPSFRTASRYIMNGMPEKIRAKLYKLMINESGRAAWEIRWGKITVDYKKITCPVLVIGCGNDRIIPPQVARDIWLNFGMRTDTALLNYGSRAHWPQVEIFWEEVARDVAKWITHG